MAEAIEVVVTGSRFGCSAELMARLPALKAIVSFGVGYDPIDVPAAQARGIAISNTPEVLNDCVADLAMGLIIDGRRQLSRADRFVRAGGWLNGNLPLARRVTGSRLGILGLGRIGLAVARRAEGFAMPVRYHNRRPLTDCPYEYAGSLVELARWADVLLLTCVGGPQTRGPVDRDVLEALGPEGLLVNVARGSVVDEPALVDALQAGRLGGAALDVFAQNPVCPRRCWAWTTWSCCRISAAPPGNPRCDGGPGAGQSATLPRRGAAGDAGLTGFAGPFAVGPLP